MAVLSSLPGISVAVHNDQGQLPEYADADPDIVKDLESPPSVVVSNYVEAPLGGGPFWFKFRVEEPYIHQPHRVMFRYEIQGSDDNSGKSCGPQDVEDTGFWETTFTGYTGTDEREQWYVENGEIKDGKHWYFADTSLAGRENREQSVKQSYSSPTRTEATKQVAANKGMSLGISYTDKPADHAAARAWPSTFINGWNNPIAVFQFKYRSRADLQKLQLIEKTPNPGQLPRENTLPLLPTVPVPLQARSLSAGPAQFRRETTLPILSTIPVPSHTQSSTPNPGQLPRKNTLPILSAIPVPLLAPCLTPISRAFEDLTFAEVRDLARKQHKSFDELNGDEVEKLARQEYSEETAHADGGIGLPSSSSLPHASRVFEDLKFDEVLDLARNQHKDFKELNWGKIRSLAMQKHCEIMNSSRAAVSEAPDARNGVGKRKAEIQSENEDEDVIFVSETAAKKRRSNSNRFL